MKIAIVGAGPAGLAAAWHLKEAPVNVQIFEKSQGVSGRAASRSRHGARFDLGANYFKLESENLQELVLHALPTEELVRIEAEVWTFDGQGQLAPGDPVYNQQARWTYSSGISTLGKLLAEAAGAPIHRGCRITGLRRRDRQWSVFTEGGDAPEGGDFDAVLLTPPAPQTVELIAHSELDPATGEALIEALKQARYHSQLCFALGFREPLKRPDRCFAMINTDRTHDVAWLSFENDKPGRKLGGHTVMMVQMSPDWSAEHLQTDPAQLVPIVAERALALLGPDRPPLAWSDNHRWRYAHPYQAADISGLETGAAAGLYFAGDALVGKGRVGGAMQTGIDAAEQILAALR